MREILSELSSIATALEELASRITSLAGSASPGDPPAGAPDGAGRASGGNERELAAELYTVERALDGARRRLLRAVDKAGR